MGLISGLGKAAGKAFLGGNILDIFGPEGGLSGDVLSDSDPISGVARAGLDAELAEEGGGFWDSEWGNMAKTQLGSPQAAAPAMPALAIQQPPPRVSAADVQRHRPTATPPPMRSQRFDPRESFF